MKAPSVGLIRYTPERIDTKHGRWYITPPNPAAKQHQFPGVTTILSATMTEEKRQGLERWRKREGLEKAEAVVKDACDRGTWLHTAIEEKLESGHDPSYSWAWMPWWNSVKQFLPRIKRVLLMEGAVHNPEYQYAGTFDLLAELDDGRTVLVDWKTSAATKKPEYLIDYQLQLGAYARAIEKTYYDSGIHIEGAFLVIALPDQKPQVIEYTDEDLEVFFGQFADRCKQYWDTYHGTYHGDD